MKAALLALLLGLLMLLVACGQAGVEDAPTAKASKSQIPGALASVTATAAPTATVPADRACESTDLQPGTQSQLAEKSGQHSVPIVLTNRSESACYLFGYPAVQLLNLANQPLAFVYEQTGDPMVTSRAPRQVNISPGGAAYVLINKFRCDIQASDRAATLLITLPGQASALRIDLGDQFVLDYCPLQAQSLVVHISPVEPSLLEALAP